MAVYGHVGRLVPAMGAVALLVGCGQSVSSMEPAEEDVGIPSERQLSAEERAQQQAKVRSINRCLGLVEAVASLKVDEVANSLRAQGIDLSASDLFPIVLSKATQVERDSGLSETEINGIIEESKVRLESPEQAMALLPEIKTCFDTYKPAADSPVYSRE